MANANEGLPAACSTGSSTTGFQPNEEEKDDEQFDETWGSLFGDEEAFERAKADERAVFAQMRRENSKARTLTGFQPNEEKGEGEDDESLCMFFGGKEKLAQARAAEMAMEDDTGVDWNDFYGDEEELDQAKADEQAMFARIWRHRERAPLPILGPTVHSMANDCKSSPGTNIGDPSQPPPWRPTPGQPSAGTNPVDQQIRRRRVKETKEERRQGDKRERRIRKTEEDEEQWELDRIIVGIDTGRLTIKEQREQARTVGEDGIDPSQPAPFPRPRSRDPEELIGPLGRRHLLQVNRHRTAGSEPSAAKDDQVSETMSDPGAYSTPPMGPMGRSRSLPALLGMYFDCWQDVRHAQQREHHHHAESGGAVDVK